MHVAAAGRELSPSAENLEGRRLGPARGALARCGMTICKAASAVIALSFFFASARAEAAANLIDADFEEGDLDGWNRTGADANDTVTNVSAAGLDMEGSRCIHIHNQDDSAGNLQLLKQITQDYNRLVALEYLVRKPQTDRAFHLYMRKDPNLFYVRLIMAADGTVQNNGTQIGSLTYSANTTYRYRIEIDLDSPTTWDFYVDGSLVGDNLPTAGTGRDKLEYIQFICFNPTTDVYIDDVEFYGSPSPQAGDNQMKWVGETDTNWSTATNWAPKPNAGAVPPTPADDVRIESTACATNAPVVDGAATAKDVLIESGGSLDGGSTTLTVYGDWTNDGTFMGATGTVAFSGTSTVLGSSTTAFNNVTITGALTGHATSMELAGNWTNNGTFTHNSGTVVFDGTTTVSGSSTTGFADVTISGALTGHSGSMNVAGDWTNNGTFTHNSGEVVFNGTTTVGGTSTTTFDDLTVTNDGTVTIATDTTVNGTLALDWGSTLTVQAGKTLTLNTSSTLDGTLTLQAGSTLELGDGVTLTSGRLTSGLFAHWKLDETVAGPVVDSAGTSNGTNNGATINQTGKIDTAYSFDGTAGYVEVAHSTALADAVKNDCTVAGWAKLDVDAADQTSDMGYVLDFGSAHTSGVGLLFNKSHASFTAAKISAYYNSAHISSSVTGVAGTWYHIALVHSGTDLTLYVNGVPDGSGSAGALTVGSSYSLRIGTQSKSLARYLDGVVDDVRIYDRALSASEIEALYDTAVQTGAFNASGTGWGAGDYVIVTSTGGADYCSVDLAGDVNASYVEFDHLSSGGLTLSGSTGATVSTSNVNFRSNQGGAGSAHMKITGTDWDDYTFDGFSFEGTGTDDPAYAVEISTGGTVTMSDYDTGTGRIYRDTYDNEVSGTVTWADVGPAPTITGVVADDPDDGDSAYGVGDTITIAFDVDTNRSMDGQTKTGAEMDGLFALSGDGTFGDSGDSYSLAWTDARTLVVTVKAVSTSSVTIGDTITVQAAADIRDSTGASPPCTGTSPAMTGDWGTLPPPGAFSLLTPTDAATDVSLTPTLDWEDSSDVATYTLLVDDDEAFASPEVDDTTLTSSTYTFGAGILSPGVTYYWRVTAVNDSDSTDASNNDFSFTTVKLLSAVLTVPATGEAGSRVTIGVEVSSGAEPYAITLDFGDGSPVYVEAGSTGSVTMDHVYATAGEFGVSVTARDSADAVATDAATILVSPDETPPVLTVISPESGSTVYDTKVTLVGTVSEPVTSVAVQGEEIGETPATIHADGVHWYATVPSLCEGSYALTVAATDLAGNTTTVDFDLEVVVPKKLTVTIAEPTATQVALDEPVTFEATAKGGLEPYGYSWDFGDGSTVDASPPITHTYASTGYFLVTLTVTDSGAEVGSDAVVLEVVPPALVPQVIFSPASPKVGERVTFDAGATEGEACWYYWDWDGDGGFDEFSPSPAIVHVFAQMGAHDVTLLVEGTYGQTVSTSVCVPVSAGGEVAVIGVSPASISFRGRPGVEEQLERHVTVTNGGPAGSVAAVTVDADRMPQYVTVSPLKCSLLSGDSETIAVQLDLSSVAPGQDIHAEEPLVISAEGAAGVPANVAVTIDLSQYGGDIGGCSPGTRRSPGFLLALVLACLTARRTASPA